MRPTFGATRLLVVTLGAASTFGCAAGEVPCGAAGACAAGRACVVGLCRPLDAAPSPQETTRFVLPPKDVAVIASKGGGAGQPEAFAFGRAANGTVELLLRFEAPWGEGGEVTSAFVVLEPLDGAPAAVTPARVDAAKIIEPWSSQTVSWGRQPRLGPFAGASSLRPSGRIAARVDVTRIVKAWGKRQSDDHGIALIAEGDDAYGTVFTLGPTGGQGPRLEAYVR
jgi:hypothetical protein